MAEVTRSGTGYITGGGYLVLNSASGLVAGDSGSKNNFGFNVANNKSGNNLQGHLNTIIRGAGRVYQVKTNAINSLYTDPNNGFATYSAKASIQDITDPNNPVPVDGNASLKVDMHDVGDSLAADTGTALGSLRVDGSLDGQLARLRERLVRGQG